LANPYIAYVSPYITYDMPYFDYRRPYFVCRRRGIGLIVFGDFWQGEGAAL
jgi:hypothetical protein